MEIRNTMNIVHILLAMMLMLFVVTAHGEPLVGFSEKRIKAKQGDTITIDIVMKDFPASEGGGLSLSFDPSVLNILAVNLNKDLWDFVTQEGNINNKDGQITDILFSSYKGVSGEATIVTVEFQAISHGKTKLWLHESLANPFASQGQRMAVEFDSARVFVK